jgi:hypothetical protein
MRAAWPSHLRISTALQNAAVSFLACFPLGFEDERYSSWERDYKWNAHLKWEQTLNRQEFRTLLASEKFQEVTARAVRIESRTSLLFSFEKWHCAML